jgi:hypothetical protein
MDRRRAIKIAPSSVVDARYSGEEGGNPTNTWFLYFFQLLWGFIVAAIIGLLAAFIGLYLLRIYNLIPGQITLKLVLDEVFKKPFPPLNDIIANISTGAAFAVVLFAKYFKEDQGNNSPGWFTRIIGAVVALLGLDIYLLNITAPELYYFSINLYQIGPILIAQAVSAFVVILLTPLFRSLGKVTVFPKVKINTNNTVTNTLNAIIFLVICGFLLWFITFTSTRGLPSTDFVRLPGGQLNNISLTIIGGWLAGIACAAIFYWPRNKIHSIQINRLRFVVFVICAATIAYLYTTHETVDGLLISGAVSAAGVLFSVPLQRSMI